MKKITTDKALIFSAIILVIYSIYCMILLWQQKPLDSTLTASIFLAFGVAEGGYCTFIHQMKKKYGEENNDDE